MTNKASWVRSEDQLPLAMAVAMYQEERGNIGDAQLQQSTSRYAVWESPTTVYVALRGTDFDAQDIILDLLDDFNIAFTNSCNLTLTQQVPTQFDKPIVFTGHSLGGTAAMCLASKTPNSRAVSFNGGAPPSKPFRSGPGPARARHYHVEGDLVSSHMDPSSAEIVRVRLAGPQWGSVYPHATDRFYEEGTLINANQLQASLNRWAGTQLRPFVCLRPIPGSSLSCLE